MSAPREPGAPDPAAHAGFEAELRIDWLPVGRERSDGLGLTILPGKRGQSQRYPGRTYRRDADADLQTLREAGVTTLILLVEDDELLRWSTPDLVERGRRHGLTVSRHPIPDGEPPASIAAVRSILSEIQAARSVGRVAVACMGGVGRTGTIAACALVAEGASATEAIDAVRAARHPTAVETSAQEAFVHEFARAAASTAT